MEDKTTNIPLANFQEWMQQLLLDPFQKTEIDPRQLLPEAFQDSTLEDVIASSEKLGAKEHLAIYQRSYIARLRQCMSQQFSALEYALGEDVFCAFADDYLANQPSQNYNLALLGANFADFLNSNRPDKEEKEDWIDFIIELAHFEYSFGVIFEEKADENYQLALQENLEETLSLVPICHLFKFQFPTANFFTEFKNKNRPTLPFERESYCVVLRDNYKLAIYDLHREQYDFLQLLKAGQDVSTAIALFKLKYADKTQEFDKIWPSWKKRWIELKFFKI